MILVKFRPNFIQTCSSVFKLHVKKISYMHFANINLNFNLWCTLRHRDWISSSKIYNVTVKNYFLGQERVAVAENSETYLESSWTSSYDWVFSTKTYNGQNLLIVDYASFFFSCLLKSVMYKYNTTNPVIIIYVDGYHVGGYLYDKLLFKI